jgi:hypothetical protein
VVDGEQVWLGSSNWGADYFMASRNVSVVVGSRRLAATLTGIFERLSEGPYAAPVEPDRRYPLPRIAE